MYTSLAAGAGVPASIFVGVLSSDDLTYTASVAVADPRTSAAPAAWCAVRVTVALVLLYLRLLIPGTRGACDSEERYSRQPRQHGGSHEVLFPWNYKAV